MKNLLKFVSILLLFIFSVFAFAETSELVDTEEQFLKNIDESFALRKQGIDFYNANVEKFKKTDNLTHSDLENIYKFSTLYISHREKLLREIKEIQQEIHLMDRVVIDTTIKTEVKTVLGIKTHYINPLEVPGQMKLRNINKVTAYGLILFDNYLALVAPYYSHRKVRYLLNRDFPGRDRQFDKIAQNFFRIKQRRFLMKGIKIYEDAVAVLEKAKIETPEFETYVNQLISTSPSVAHLKDVGIIEYATLVHLIQRVTGELRYGTRASSFQTSKVFGNTMGIFQSRKGKMKSMGADARNELAAKLKPLDVLMEKTPFRLTDSFIPGYYGHVAIWVGTESELRELGIWNHPAVVPHQEKIKSGHHIVEALRPGVQINTLEHFLDIDDFVSVRPNSLSSEQTKEYLIRAFQQIGKAYDFNFDVETDNLIVCSEIAYVVYHNVDWPTDRMLGRSTISPDHVAWEAAPGKAFTPVVLFKDGKEILENIEGVFMENISGPERMK